MATQSGQEYSIVSSKNNAVLLRSKNDSLSYRIQFKIESKIPLEPKQHIGFDMYNDLLKLNDDVLDDISIEQVIDEPQARYVLMQIKPVGASLGIKGKYIITKVNLICPDDKKCVGLVGGSVELSQTSFQPNLAYDELVCTSSSLFAFWDDPNKCMVVQYDFTLMDPLFQKNGLQVPRAVSDFSALLIKKLFLRIKEYKEKQITKTQGTHLHQHHV